MNILVCFERSPSFEIQGRSVESRKMAAKVFKNGREGS